MSIMNGQKIKAIYQHGVCLDYVTLAVCSGFKSGLVLGGEKG